MRGARWTRPHEHAPRLPSYLLGASGAQVPLARWSVLSLPFVRPQISACEGHSGDAGLGARLAIALRGCFALGLGGWGIRECTGRAA
jgi:hypothetical protein